MYRGETRAQQGQKKHITGTGSPTRWESLRKEGPEAKGQEMHKRKTLKKKKKKKKKEQEKWLQLKQVSQKGPAFPFKFFLPKEQNPPSPRPPFLRSSCSLLQYFYFFFHRLNPLLNDLLSKIEQLVLLTHPQYFDMRYSTHVKDFVDNWLQDNLKSHCGKKQSGKKHYDHWFLTKPSQDDHGRNNQEVQQNQNASLRSYKSVSGLQSKQGGSSSNVWEQRCLLKSSAPYFLQYFRHSLLLTKDWRWLILLLLLPYCYKDSSPFTHRLLYI